MRKDKYGLKYIYTEKIHHITCKGCEEQFNTTDGREDTKLRAAIVFIEQGWKYIYGKGWFCYECTKGQ